MKSCRISGINSIEASTLPKDPPRLDQGSHESMLPGAVIHGRPMDSYCVVPPPLFWIYSLSINGSKK